MAAPITIGVLALQGDFAEHIDTFKRCDGVITREIRKTEQLAGLDGLVIPGGESTVMVKLLVEFGMFDDLRAFGTSGQPMFGTCAGCIMMAKSVDGNASTGVLSAGIAGMTTAQKTLDLADYSVVRNAYGPQIHSFESDLNGDKAVFGEEPLRAVLIRAPMISRVGEGGRVLAQHDSHPVLWQQGNILTCTFHPEITGDKRVHAYFASMVRASGKTPYAPK
eukprot:CAMPEP_0180145172 /NCGR_PEP_ID=MMETSP0986-20121125/17477_1 /TAXON_ID=697907 /ORGANISM="non described non described, Strain CCMP2293" /LENGTH=220 /DNA_ID=CAMNT_0022089429 /DNA_START=49 /DNA_END=711 /DNA_ORIENTATION=+